MNDLTGEPVYLDHAATTPMVPAAIEAMTRHLSDVGNPSSLHASGRRARRVVEEARETIALALNCRPGDVVFTSGGTEADNLALKGTFWSRREADPRRTRILSTAVEHHAVLDPLIWLAEEIGAEVELLPVDETGRLELDALRAAVDRDPESVALISVMWANNEVGTLQPIDEVVAIAAPHGIPVHTDAIQAVGAVPVDFSAIGVDLMTITGHKIGGPFGVGALLVRRELEVTAMLHGGGQERDIRSGTLDAPAIAGFAAAVEAAVKAQPEHAERLAAAARPVGPRGPAGGARRDRQRTPDRAAAGQRPPAVPRLRRRLAAHAPRRPRHRVLHRVGVLGRGRPAVPRADGDGSARGGRAQLAALLPRPHQHRRRRRRPGRRDRPVRRPGPRVP